MPQPKFHITQLPQLMIPVLAMKAATVLTAAPGSIAGTISYPLVIADATLAPCTFVNLVFRNGQLDHNISGTVDPVAMKVNLVAPVPADLSFYVAGDTIVSEIWLYKK